MKSKIIIASVLIIVLVSCSIRPSKIEYGADTCHFCKMNIVEKTHAAQLVTKKGKTFKYDAIECMLNDLQNKNKENIGLHLITDYNRPTELIDATKATFLISDLVQSPMGANLSGFQAADDALSVTNEADGQLYNWIEIQALFRNN